VFIAASLDDRLRAFDIENGKLLWEVKLPAGGQATPMTYSINGRQYLVIAAGGYKGDSTRGDYLIAYALGGTASSGEPHSSSEPHSSP
jgi:quinoprotein glucose dehydrogenase